MLGLIVLSVLLPAVELSLSKNHTLYIVALAAYPDTVIIPSWNGGASLTPAARVAVDEINNNSSILPDYRLELLERDDACDITFKAVTSFIETSFYSGKQVIGMVGPGCSEGALAIGELSKHDSIATLMVSVATTVELDNRTAYPYILRTVSSSYVYVKTYFDLMRQNNWKSVAVLFDYYRTYFSYTFDKFKDELMQNGNITFVGGVTETYFPLDALVQSRARVILGFLGGQVAPQLLCLAYHKKIMYPTYQWVFHDRSPNEFENGASFPLVDPSCPEGMCVCSGWELQAVLNNAIFCHYKLQRDYSDNTSLISGENFTTFFNDTYKPAVHEYIAEKDIPYPIDLLYGPTYYDTVWSLARALDRADRMDNVSLKDYWPARGVSQLQTTKTILKRFFDTDFSFEGASGRISFSNVTGDTSTVVNIYQLGNNSDEPIASVTLLGVFDGTNLSLTVKGNFITDTFHTELVTLDIRAAVLFIVLQIVAFVSTVSLHIINGIYRHSAALKATSPKLNHIIFLGCYMIIAATMIFIVLGSFKPTTPNFAVQDFLCNAFWWLLVLGFTIIFGIMIGRLWRIYRIFTHFDDPGSLLSNYHLLGFVGLLISISSGCLVLWMVIDRLKYDIINTSIIDFNVIVYWDCNCRHFVFWILGLVLFLGILLGMMVTLAVLTRHITNRNFKYTKSTTALAYLLGILLCTGVPIYALFLHNTFNVNVTHSFMCVVLVSSVYLCNILIFLPPVVSIYREKYSSLCSSKQASNGTVPFSVK